MLEWQRAGRDVEVQSAPNTLSAKPATVGDGRSECNCSGWLCSIARGVWLLEPSRSDRHETSRVTASQGRGAQLFALTRRRDRTGHVSARTPIIEEIDGLVGCPWRAASAADEGIEGAYIEGSTGSAGAQSTCGRAQSCARGELDVVNLEW
jgi:hypothetical protein